MKPKISLDKASLKQFFLDNLEKLLFGLVVLVFLFLVYRAVSPEKLGFTSEEMLQAAQTAKTNLTKTEPSDVPKPPPYRTKAGENRKSVNFAIYEHAKAFNEPIKRYDTKRGTPPLLALKDLRASSGKGAFAMASEDDLETGMMSQRQLRGQRWVIVTGLIDYAAQVDAYKQTLESAIGYDPYRDFPSYAYFRIERAEVDPAAGDTDPDQLAWTRLKVNDAMSVMDLWTSQASQEVVDQRFWPVNPVLMFPLGPLVDRQWGTEVAHLPQITLAEPEETGMGMGPYGPGGRPRFEKKKGEAQAEGREGEAKAGGQEEAAEDGEKPAAKKKQVPRKRVRKTDTPDEPDEPATGPGGYAMGGAMPGGPQPGYGGMRTPGYSGMRSPMGSGAMPRPSPAMPGPMGSGMRTPRGGSAMGSMAGSMPPGYMKGPGRPPAASGYGGAMPGYGPGMAGYGADGTGEYEIPPPEQYLLFRFFDFDVRPGKHYRYRVKLVLDNPNLGIPPQHLLQPEQAKQKRLETEWCPACSMVSVPLDSQVLALSAERKLQDSQAKVLVVNFNMETGLDAYEEHDAPRGQWLNFLQREFERPGGAMGSMGAMGPMGGSMGYGMGNLAASEEEAEKVDYITNCLVLDVAGGAKLPGKEKDRLTEPASVLLIDKDGNLVVRNELADLTETKRYQEPEEKTSTYPGMAGPAGPGPGGPPMPGYPGMDAKGKKGKGKAGSMGSSSMPPGYEASMMGSGGKQGKGKGKMAPGYPGYPGYPGGLEGLDDSRKKKGGKKGP